jgi:hypothetical protein
LKQGHGISLSTNRLEKANDIFLKRSPDDLGAMGWILALDFNPVFH